jgi:hypothetical protein
VAAPLLTALRIALKRVWNKAAPHYATATAKLFKHAVAGNGLADHRRESYVQSWT